MNLRPVVVKVRPAWRRAGYRFGRHPLPVPRRPAAGFGFLSLPDLLPDPADIPAAANGHGGKPGPLARADR